MAEKRTEGLTASQQRFIAERTAGSNIKEAALKAGIAEQTAHRWLKQASVQAALSQEAEHVKESARAVIERYYAEALETSCQVVIGVATNILSPAAARLNAAKMIQERLAPVATASAEEQENAVPRGVDFSIFTQDELDIVQPIFARAEERRRIEQGETGIPQLRRNA